MPRFIKRLRNVRQAGDTIVEVLICMAIVSAGLSAAYAISRNSLSRVREAQEHGEALKLAEQQIERLKQLVATNTSINKGDHFEFPAGGLGTIYTFCITQDMSGGADNGKLTVKPVGPGDLGDLSKTDCRLDPAHQYITGIYYDSDHTHNPNQEFYIFAGRFVATGTNANTHNYDVVNLMYRIHP